jgi:hypothetical protein
MVVNNNLLTTFFIHALCSLLSSLSYPKVFPVGFVKVVARDPKTRVNLPVCPVFNAYHSIR